MIERLLMQNVPSNLALNNNGNRWAGSASYIVGLIDASTAFSYLFGVDLTIWYLSTLILKSALAISFKAPGHRTAYHSASFFLIIVFLFLCSAIGNSVGLTESGMFGGFVIHLLLTLLLLHKNYVTRYTKGISDAGLVISCLYVPVALAGFTGDLYGRYLFFGGSHPNLGSEIIAMSVIAASFSYRPKAFFFFAAMAITSVALMQGRSALLVILLSVLLRVYPYVSHSFKSRRRIVVSFLVALILLLALVKYFGHIVEFFSVMLRYNDEYRGVNTGLVGRYDRWTEALRMFGEKPLFGWGFNYFSMSGIATPHNAFLYGITEFGIMSFMLWGYLVQSVSKLVAKSGRQAILLSPILVLAILNDRFIDLNIYPFAVYVLLIVARLGSSKSESVSLGRARFDKVNSSRVRSLSS